MSELQVLLQHKARADDMFLEKSSRISTKRANKTKKLHQERGGRKKKSWMPLQFDLPEE